MLKTFEYKLGRMRKPDSYHVMPASDGQLIVQGHKSIGKLDFRTREGVLTTKGCYFPHLALATPFTFPEDFVAKALEACPSQGGTTELGGGMVILQNTVELI